MDCGFWTRRFAIAKTKLVGRKAAAPYNERRVVSPTAPLSEDSNSTCKQGEISSATQFQRRTEP